MAKDSNCVVWSPKMKKWAIISCGTLVVLAATATYLSSCRRRRRFGLKEERTPGTKHKAGHESGEIVEGPECKPVGQKEMARRASDHAAVGRWQRETGAAPLQSVSSPSVVEREPKKTGGGGGARERIQSIVSRYSGASQGGIAPHNPNKQNQDALVMAMDRVTSSVFLAVLDGHGQAGRRVSQAFRMRLAEEVFNHPEWRTCCETAITESIAKIEAHVQANIMIDTKSSGTTLVSACLRGTRLTVTNVGDSRAVLGRRLELESGAGKDSSRTMLVAQRLTEDHKPDVQREERRILAAGGRVFAVSYRDDYGPPRVWHADRDEPGLAMSRSLGDSDAEVAGVISESDVFRYDLAEGKGCADGDGAGPGREAAEAARGEPEVLILASDGLWDVFSDQEAVDVASRYVDLGEATSTLVKQARKRWLRQEKMVDDITVCIARFKTRSKWPQFEGAAATQG